MRALAVLAVIAYHVNLPFTQGGFLGVTVFFVLSGYLITSLLVAEWEKTKRIDIKQFWIQRAKRLLPAMFFLLLILNVLVPILHPALVAHLHKDTLAALFYVSNWHYIFQDLSYFETFQLTSFLTHFWSLAIEEQFYIFWAIAIFYCFKYGIKRRIIVLGALGLALISILSMLFMYDPNLDPSRVYYGTDTRLFSLLIGASVALFLPSHHLTANASKEGKRVFEGMGIIGFLTFAIMLLTVNQYESFVYRGGMVILSLTTAMWILSIASPSTVFMSRLLSFAPLKWIGMRSYGIYLWHYPIISLMDNYMPTQNVSFLKIAMEVILIFGCAMVSYTFVEVPIRKGNITIHIRKTMATLLATTIVLLSVNVYAAGVNEKEQEKQAKEAEQTKHVVVKVNHVKKQKKEEEKQKTMTAIGDSVLINPSEELQAEFPAITIDAKVGRQMWNVNEVVQDLKQKKQLGDIVVIALGSNGAFQESALTGVLNSIGESRKIILINVRVPKPWESIVNKELATISKEYKNVKVLDWHKESENHPEYFVSDGVHLQPKGSKAFVNMIEQEVESKKKASR